MLSRIAEQVGEGVVVSDNDGKFLYVNQPSPPSTPAPSRS
jgi:hypothetical protein